MMCGPEYGSLRDIVFFCHCLHLKVGEYCPKHGPVDAEKQEAERQRRLADARREMAALEAWSPKP